MIKIETEKDGKINAAICGAPDEVIPEFFSLLHHIAKICMHNCKDGQHEEFAAALLLRRLKPLRRRRANHGALCRT